MIGTTHQHVPKRYFQSHHRSRYYGVERRLYCRKILITLVSWRPAYRDLCLTNGTKMIRTSDQVAIPHSLALVPQQLPMPRNALRTPIERPLSTHLLVSKQQTINDTILDNFAAHISTAHTSSSSELLPTRMSFTTDSMCHDRSPKTRDTKS